MAGGYALAANITSEKNAIQVNKAMLLTLRKRSLTFVIVFMKEPFFYSNTTFVRFTSLLLRATITSENVRLSARCRAGPIMSIIVPTTGCLTGKPSSEQTSPANRIEWMSWQRLEIWRSLTLFEFRFIQVEEFDSHLISILYEFEYIPFEKLRVIQPTVFPFNITQRRYILAFSRYWTYIVRNNCLGWEIP